MSRQERRARARQQEKADRQQERLAQRLDHPVASRSPLAGTRGWLAAGALATYAAFGPSHPALAATPTPAPAPGDPVATLPLKRFDIPAGPLDAALDAYSHTADLTLRVDVAHNTLAGFQTKGVKGLYRPEEALRILLEGTGLQSAVQPGAAPTDSPVAIIGLRVSTAVDVNSQLPDAVSMAQFTEPLIDTPQTIVAVPQFALHEQQNTTLKDALRNVPGISLAAGEFGAQGDNLTIRGFTARNDIFLDGIRDFGSYYRDSFDYEQVEVLEGPAGVQFGRGSTGGIINQETKTPAAQPFTNVKAQFGTDATRRIEADINRPLPDLAGGTAFRLPMVATEGGVSERPFAANRHYGIAPSLAFGLNAPTHGSVTYYHLNENDTPDYGIPWLINKQSPASRSAYFGFPDSNYFRASVDVLTGKVEHEFNHSLSLRSIARWANYARSAQITEPQICSNAAISTPVGGYVSTLPTSSVTGLGNCTYTPATPANKIAVNRNQLQTRSVEGDLWDQTTLTARFNILGVRNDVNAGVEGGQEISNPIRFSYVPGSVPSTNLANPNPQSAVFSGQGYVNTITHTKSDSVGLFFVDTLHLGRLFELSGGIRWDYFDTTYNVYSPPNSVGVAPAANIGPLEQIVHQPTYRAAFVYKPTSHGSIYFDYGTSFNPSAESLSLSVATSVLPPEENESYEAGAKYSLLHNRLMLDGAWFRTTQLNARETSPTNSNLIVLSGTQRVQGMQASAVGQLSNGFNLVLGYAYLNSAVIASQYFPTSVGYPLANVPKQTFNAFLTHNLVSRVKFGLGGNYVGSRTASSTVPYVPLTFSPAINFTPGTAPCGATLTVCYQVLSTGMKQVPGYWVFNASLSRPITDRIELQANVYNMLNRFFIDLPHPSHLIPGPGISAMIGANFHF